MSAWLLSDAYSSHAFLRLTGRRAPILPGQQRPASPRHQYLKRQIGAVAAHKHNVGPCGIVFLYVQTIPWTRRRSTRMLKFRSGDIHCEHMRKHGRAIRAVAALLATAILVEGFVLPRTAHHNVHNLLRATKDTTPSARSTRPNGY